MSVLCEAISVVMRNSVLEDRYPGGLAAYILDLPNGTFCTDGSLIRVGFMVPSDAAEFLALLAGKGFTPVEDGRFEDVAVVDQETGMHLPCSWVETGRDRDGNAVCWERGREPGETALPVGWERARMTSVRHASPAHSERYEFLKTENLSDVYLDRHTGKTVTAARPFGGQTEQAAVRRLMEIGRALSERERVISASGLPSGEDVSAVEGLLSEALSLGPLEAKKNRALAAQVAGYALRVLERFDEAEKHFEKMVENSPEQVSGWLELTRCQAEQGKLDLAEKSARKAVEVGPRFAGAHGNLAMVYIQSGKKEQAWESLSRALEIDPGDERHRYLAENFHLL